MRAMVMALVAMMWAAPAAAETDPDARPKALGFGLGGGVTLPETPLGLDTMSGRLRINDYLTLEPVVGYTSANGSQKSERANGSTETTTSGTELVFEANARYRIGKRTRVEPQVLGGLGYRQVSTEVDPDGTDNKETSESTDLFVQWGFGLECFLGPHWSVSADGTNPLYMKSTRATVFEANDREETSSTTTVGVAWDPAIRFQVHLYL